MAIEEKRVDFLPEGTATGSGLIVHHDVTRYGLGRMAVELQGAFPDVETWSAVLIKRGLSVLLYRYEDRLTRAGMVGRLWLYYRA